MSKIVTITKPLKLQSGQEIKDFDIAYKTWGKLNKTKSNVILICHALTGDQYVTGKHPVTGKPGWWHKIVGKGKIIDTDKYFVICSNVIGGCMGSFGPKTINPKTKKPYGQNFPFITIGDMVDAQKMLLDELGITKLKSVIGGSMGGMQALEWAAKYSKMVKSTVIIASTSRHSAQNIAFHEIGRQAIMADPNWHAGDYDAHKTRPDKGLSVARMTAHVTYMSEDSLADKFGRNLQDRDNVTYGFDADFQVESYLRYQGINFVDRFDANSYLYITRAMDYFDMEGSYSQKLSKIFENNTNKFCIISFTTDWLYPTAESKYIVRSLNASTADVTFVEVETNKGHDAFLLDVPEFEETLKGFYKQL